MQSAIAPDTLVPHVFDGQIYDATAGIYVQTVGGNAYESEIGRTLTGEAYAYQRNNPIHPEKVDNQAISPVNWESLAGPDADGFTNSFNRVIGTGHNYLVENPGQGVHLGLDLAGAVPIFGAPFDAINAAYYLAEGDFENAAISGVAAVPGLGYLAGVSQGAKYTAKATSFFRRADIAANFAISGYLGIQGVRQGNGLQVGIAALGLGINSAAIARGFASAPLRTHVAEHSSLLTRQEIIASRTIEEISARRTRAQMLNRVRNDLASADPHDQLAAQVARRYWRELEAYDRIVHYPGTRRPFAQVDVEFRNVIVEITTGKGRGKTGQIDLLNSPLTNPSRKPVVQFLGRRASSNRIHDRNLRGAFVIHAGHEPLQFQILERFIFGAIP